MSAQNPAQLVPIEYSRYLARLAHARADLATALGKVDAGETAPLDQATLQTWLNAPSLTEESLKPALRRLKQQAMAHIALRDLCGHANLAEVVECMSLVADIAVTTALEITEAALIARYGEPKNAMV